MFHRVSRNYDRYRWLRSDGTPNFSQRLVKRPGDAGRLARSPRELYSPNISILGLFEVLYRERVAALPLVKAGRLVDSVVSGKDLVSFLGGPYSGVIETRHRGSLLEALVRETARSISRRDFPRVSVDADLEEVLETMVLSDAGYVVVLDRDERLAGIVSERDIVELFRGRRTGVLVRDVMTRSVVYSRYTDTLCDILRDMSILDIRRIPLVREDGSLAGIVTVREVIEFIGSHRIFSYVVTGSYEEFCRLPVSIVAREAVVVPENTDIGDLAERALNEGVHEFIVVEGGEIRGIVTERDLVYGFTVLSR